MKKSTRVTEWIKNLLILLLSLLAVFLAWKTGLFNDVLDSKTEYTVSEQHIFTANAYYHAAYPKAAAVTWKSGMRFGISYDYEVMKKILSGFSVLLEEAYGTVSNIHRIPESEWRLRLGSTGLYIEYNGCIFPSVLASWFGTETLLSDEFEIKRFLLTVGDDHTVLLCFQDADSEYYSCDTYTLEASLDAAVQKWLPNGAEFAYQIPSLDLCSPYLLIADSELSCCMINRIDPNMDNAVQETADLLELRRDSSGSYEEQNERVFLCEKGILRVTEPNRFNYVNISTDSPVHAAEIKDKAEIARRIMQGLASACGGESELELFSCSEEEGFTEISFAWFIDGIPVICSDEEACYVRFEDDKLTEILFFAECFQKTEETVSLLPELQAAAAAAAVSFGNAVELAYLDNGGSNLCPVWIGTNGEK